MRRPRPALLSIAAAAQRDDAQVLVNDPATVAAICADYRLACEQLADLLRLLVVTQGIEDARQRVGQEAGEPH